MQRKIMVLIGTDIACWLPICILAFCSYLGIYLSDIVYIVAAVVLLPINSAVNPIIYSNYGVDFEFNPIDWIKGLKLMKYLGEKGHYRNEKEV